MSQYCGQSAGSNAPRRCPFISPHVIITGMADSLQRKEVEDGPVAWVWPLLVAVSLFLLAQSGSVPGHERLAQLLSRGQAHQAAREYAAAIRNYQEAGRVAPALALPLVRIGQVYLAQHRYPLAIGMFLQALSLEGTRSEALLGLAESYAAQGDWERAAGAAREALAWVPGWREARLLLGRAQLERGDYDQATRAFADVLAGEEDEPLAHYYLGLLLAADEAEAARRHLQAAIAGSPQSADAETALSALDEAEAAPDRPAALIRLGVLYLRLGELSLAQRAFAAAAAETPTYAEAYAYLGRTKALRGEPAMDDFRAALALEPDLVLGHYFLGSYYRAQGLNDLAEEEFWTAYRQDPDNAALCSAMATVYVGRGDYASAEEWLLAAVERVPQDPAFQLLLAHFYVDHIYQVQEKGVEAASRAVELAPQSAEAHDLLGWAYFLVDDFAHAEESLRRALDLDGYFAAAHYHLGALLEARGDRSGARAAYLRAVDLDTTGYYRQRAEFALTKMRR
jgi:tetratricopeptide (TPR) repeat protein